MKRRWTLVPPLTAVLIATSSILAWPQAHKRPAPPRVEIHGVVRYPGGRPVGRGVLVTLESAEGGGVTAQDQTDERGKFLFSGIDPQGYDVTVRQPGFRDIRSRVDLTTVSTAYLDVTLQPMPGERQPTTPPEGPGAKISAQELAIPEGARKEWEEGRKIYIDDKNPNGSVSHFRKAIEIYPSYASAYFFLGMANMDVKKYPEARSAFQKAIELDDKLAGAYLSLGACYNQEGNFAAAEKPLVRGLELNPEAARGQYELGRVFWALGRWPEAEPRARKSASLEPNFAPAHVLLGNIMLRKRDAPAALKEFKEYLRLDPNGPLAPPTQEIVTKIEKALSPSDSRVKP